MHKFVLGVLLFGYVKSQSQTQYDMYSGQYSPNSYSIGGSQNRLADMYSRAGQYGPYAQNSYQNELPQYANSHMNYQAPAYQESGYVSPPPYSNGNNVAYNQNYEQYFPSNYQGSYAPDNNNNNNNYNTANSGYQNYGGLGHLLRENYDKGYNDGYNVGHVKLNSDANDQMKYAGADIDLRGNGYDQSTHYNGNEAWVGENGFDRGYAKGEGYEQSGYQGFDKAEEHSGKSYAEENNVGVNNKVAYEVDHSLSYKDNYKDENHSGSYKGDEFDVAYKATDVQGGYANQQSDNSYKGAAYDGIDHQGSIYNTGKYDGNDYMNQGSVSKDAYYRENGYDMGSDNGGFSDGKDGNLYAKYAGNAQSGDYQNEDPKSMWNDRNYGSYNKYGDYSKDQFDVGYGAGFEGTDTYGKSQANEGYVGADEQISQKSAYDIGQYRDVAATGHNKEAHYEGDYQTNNKEHDVDYNVKHYEDLQTDFNTDVQKDQYLEKYNGNDYKGGYDAEQNYGAFRDNEFAHEYDQNGHFKNYQGDSFANGVSVEADVAQYHGQAANAYDYAQKADIQNGNNANGNYDYGASARYGGGYYGH